MTQEQKQLLIKDLCSRLPYETWVKYEGKEWLVTGYGHGRVSLLPSVVSSICGPCPLVEEVRPYLRPMSSMTEDEREEIEVFIFNEWYEEDSCKVDSEGWIEILANYDVSGIDPGFCADYVDWLNAHYFDYRDLIEKGLALEAKKGMYKTE